MPSDSTCTKGSGETAFLSSYKPSLCISDTVSSTSFQTATFLSAHIIMRSCLPIVVLHARKAPIVLVLPVPGGPSMIERASMIERGDSSVRLIASCCHLVSRFHDGNVWCSRSFFPYNGGAPSPNLRSIRGFSPARKKRLAEMAGRGLGMRRDQKRPWC